MNRAEFVQISCDFIAEGRKRNFPDMRLSEASAARVSDQKRALSLWRQNREQLAKTLTGVYLAQLRAASPEKGWI
jgi:hypothetical protein